MKNGFTLVELLAVIVILAVLALIATPVVLSIIDDAKESAMLRSAEMYLSGVENAVMRENMNSGGNFRPNECTITNGNMTCDSTNVEVEVDGEVPSTGSIIFENGKIKEVTLNYESGTIVKDNSGNLVSREKTTYISLDHWQHKSSYDETSDHIDEDKNGVCDMCGETKIPGLYKEDDSFISWEDYVNLQIDGECMMDDAPLKIELMSIQDNVITSGNSRCSVCGSNNTWRSSYDFNQLKGHLVLDKNTRSISLSWSFIQHLKEVTYYGTTEEWNSYIAEGGYYSDPITVHCNNGDTIFYKTVAN